MKFSVVIPVYNVVAELPRMMASLRAQTYRVFEIILVDDGSTDGSAALVDSYANVAKVIHQSNSGVVVARKRGFEASQGEWIVFVDGDDMLVPEALSRISAAIERCSADIIQYGYEMVLWSGEREGHLPKYDGRKSVDELLLETEKTPLECLGMCIGNKCYRRKIVEAAFDDIGDVQISHSEDGLFCMAAFLHSCDVCFLQKNLYVYILRKGSALHHVNVEIAHEKELFLSSLERIMRISGRMTLEMIRKCLDFHSYEAACYIFLSLRRNRAKCKDCRKVLMDLREAPFFNRKNKEWNSARRRIMRFILCHPFLYSLTSRIVDAF